VCTLLRTQAADSGTCRDVLGGQGGHPMHDQL